MDDQKDNRQGGQPNNAEERTNLQRAISQKQLTMIGFGGAIGAGLWFSSGEALAMGDPGAALLVYALMGILVYFMMTSLGEMATKIPLSGSFATYATRFVDPALGFTMGWSYYFSCAVRITFTIIIGARIIQFWLPPEILPPFIPSLIIFILVFLFALKFNSTKGFGASESWFVGIRLVAIILFLVFALLMLLGIIGQSPGLSNWEYAIKEGGLNSPIPGNATWIIMLLPIAAFSYQGVEVIGLSAGEASDPDKSIPKSINTVVWRILLFYIGGILMISLLVPFDDPHLFGAEVDWYEYEMRVAYSPFTLVFYNAGFIFFASVMNTIALIAVIACGNSGFFCATRMLIAMSNEGKASKAMGKINKRGIPMNALLFTSVIVFAGFFVDRMPYIEIFDYLLGMGMMMWLFVWLCIALCHWRFRKAYKAQGYKIEDLKYRAKLYPYGAVFGAILCVIAIIGSGLDSLIDFDLVWAIQLYLPILIIILLFVIYKLVKKTKVVPLDKCDFSAEYK